MSSSSDLLNPDAPLDEVCSAAASIRDRVTGRVVSYSPKVFIDLTRLCRDRCRYCTFIRMPLSSRIPLRVSGGGHISGDPQAYLEIEEVLSLAERGRKAGCKEALFTLGDRPETRYESARRFLRDRGLDSTAAYVAECASAVIRETGLLPHINPGVMTCGEIAAYRKVSVSAGLMLESTSEELFLSEDGCHYGSPDKDPRIRIESIAEAGRQGVPFTTGLLVGIGETFDDRIETLRTIASLADEFGHIQEVIVQNFRAKITIPMRYHPEPSFHEYLRTIAIARLILPGEVAVQAPPNLTPGGYERLLAAGLSDWGGISPVTPDHVNPEAPWPAIEELRERCAERGFELRARLALHPKYVTTEGWIDPDLRPAVESLCDADGWAA